jgi:hypothetical protein
METHTKCKTKIEDGWRNTNYIFFFYVKEKLYIDIGGIIYTLHVFIYNKLCSIKRRYL